MLTICDVHGASIADRGEWEKQGGGEGGRMWKKKKRKQNKNKYSRMAFRGLDEIDSPLQLLW